MGGVRFTFVFVLWLGSPAAVIQDTRLWVDRQDVEVELIPRDSFPSTQTPIHPLSLGAQVPPPDLGKQSLLLHSHWPWPVFLCILPQCLLPLHKPVTQQADCKGEMKCLKCKQNIYFVVIWVKLFCFFLCIRTWVVTERLNFCIWPNSCIFN